MGIMMTPLYTMPGVVDEVRTQLSMKCRWRGEFEFMRILCKIVYVRYM